MLVILNHRCVYDGEIAAARLAAYKSKYFGVKIPKKRLEVCKGLRQKGLIKDISPDSLALSGLYAAIYQGMQPMDIKQLTSDATLYNSWHTPTPRELDAVKSCLSKNLTQREYAVVLQKFKLFGEARPVKEFLADFGMNQQEYNKALKTAMSKLSEIKLPPIIVSLDLEEEIKACAQRMQEGIEQAKRSAEILGRLINNSQYYLVEKVKIDEAFSFYFDPTPIEDLGLEISTYNCLKRAGIKDISDIALRGKNLHKVRGLGKPRLLEVVEKVQIKYPMFSV